MKCKTFKAKYQQTEDQINNWLSQYPSIKIIFVTTSPHGDYSQITTIFYEIP